MSCRPCDPFCPTVTVFDPPQTVIRDIFHPQIVEVVHTIETVNRHHCCPIRKDVFRFTSRDETVGNNNDANENRALNTENNSYISKASSKARTKKRTNRKFKKSR